MKSLLLLLPLALASCSTITSPIVPGTKPKDHGLIGAGEGPAWKDGSLYFTDGKHINRMDPQGRTTVFRHNASNGLLFDREGRLVACESGLRRVTRTEKNGRITVLADRFNGKRFNSPNDLCMDSKGRIYFTDPRYGSRTGMEELLPLPPRVTTPWFRSGPHVDENKGISQLAQMDSIDDWWPSVTGNRFTEGVYRIDAPGKVKLLMPGGGEYRLERPNGILISPDDRYLYIADNNNNTHGGSRKLLRYDLKELEELGYSSRKVLFDWKDGRGPDGMKMDKEGRLYVAAGTNTANDFETTRFKAGCYILSPSGKLIDFVPTAPDECCNCAFGGQDGKTLFITSGNHLWSVPLR